MSRLLDVRTQLRLEGKFEAASSALNLRPVLEGNQTLQPNVLYPADKNQTIRYYLPNYQLAVENGRPAVELRYKRGDGGEVGRLTITLTWSPPAPPQGTQLRTIEHMTSLTLGYRVPVGAASGGGTAGSVERMIDLQPPVPAGNQLVRSTTIFMDKGLFDTVYQAMRSPDQAATLDLLIRGRVGVRTWNQVVVGKAAVTEQVKMLAERGVLFTEMLHTESLGTIKRVPAERAARVRVTDASPEMLTRVEATRAVAVAPPVARPTPAGHRGGAAGPLGPGRRLLIDPQVLRRLTPAADATAARRVSPVVPLGTALRVDAATMAAAHPRRVASPAASHVAAAAASTRVTAAAAAAPRAQPQVSGVVLARVNTPKLGAAVAASDLRIAGVKAVPIRAALDTEKRPAIVDAQLDNRQRLPFTFNPAEPANRALFVADEDYAEALHILVPLSLVRPGGATYTVYRDSLMPDVLYMPPSGFRLERDATPPYLPSLTFLASDFSTTTADEAEADVMFRVAAGYRLEPWLDPDIVELARAQLNNRALQFTTGTATEAKLTLDLDFLGEQALRSEAVVDPSIGITDTLDLDHQAFVQLWRERLSPSGGAVSGRVEYRLFDGSPATVRVQLSLKETSDALFDVMFVGPVGDQPGRYRVSVRNRVESPAHLTGFPPELVADGGVAHVADVTAVQNRLLQPQETVDVDYVVTGSTTPLSEFSPTILGHVEPNLPALLRSLMMTQGYSSLGFSLTVNAAAGAFAPVAADSEPLTGLLVEFDDGTKTRLTAAKTESQVTVVGRLIDQILGTADDTQRYFYRVTNLHASGEGARTTWNQGNGTAPLTVSRAGGGFDF